MLQYFDFSKQLSLYIHIPFCTTKCGYCAFYSKPCSSTETIEKYVKKIVSEIKGVVNQMNGPFYTAFIGGGNPGCLSVSQLEEICQAVCLKGRPVEFTTEMNPESLTDEHFHLFEKYLTRLSMGVQSLRPEVLSFLQRNSSIDQTLRGIELAIKLKQTNQCDLNFDLITCTGFEDYSYMKLPFADHLSVYALTVEENTPLFSKIETLPDEDQQYEILMQTWKDLRELGFEHYEVSNFAKKGKKCLHNEVYWSYGQYIGLGPAAASTAFKNGTVARINFKPDIQSYLSCSDFQGYFVDFLDTREQLEEFVLMGLRHKKGLDLDRLEKEFGIKNFEIPRFFTIKKKHLCPTERGLMTADNAAMMLTSQFTV